MALTESAISNRQACYSVSEAVKMASEGYKNGISTLSDAAGVTENLSVMEAKYAESIGKTAGQLTEAEKNQAYLNRTLEAAAPFAGATAQYMETLAGKQGEYSQALRETQVAYTEAIEPILIEFEELKTNLVSNLGELISEHKSATVGITTFLGTLLILVPTLTTLKKGYDLYKTSTLAATVATKGFTAALKSNPIGLIATGVSAAVSAYLSLKNATEEQKAKQEELNEAQAKYNEIVEGTIELNDENISSMQSTKDKLEEYKELLAELRDNSIEANPKYQSVLGIDPDEYSEKVKQIDEENTMLVNRIKELTEELQTELGIDDSELDATFGLERAFENSNGNMMNFIKNQEKGIISLDRINSALKVYSKRLDEASSIEKIKNALDIETTKSQQKEAAQLKVNANQMQKYLNTVKKGDKSTTEYQNAVQALAKAYPEAANAEGIIIDQAQNFINAEQGKADSAWSASQTTIQGNIAVINTFIELAKAAENDKAKQQELANIIGVSYSNIIPTLTSVLNVLQLIGGYTPTEVPNITPTVSSYTPSKVSSGGSSASKVYENKKLDNYKSLIEYKKSLDQISLKQEIAMYQKALNSYAKTTEEKRELRTKIYELNKEMAQKEKELLDQQTEDYEAYIQEQINKKGAAYDVKEQTKDYDAIIKMHKKYLNQIMKDERLSLDERKEIYREELQIVRDYEQQKRDLRVEAIDNTVNQLTDAITKQLEELQEKDKEFIDKQLEAIETVKDERINAINEEYDAKIEAIEKELEALDKAEEEKSRAEEDAEYERKKKRLEELIAFEHDATTKANYQKELDKLIAEYQKTLDERALQDKKDALNEQKDLIQEEQDNKIQAIEDEAEKQKEAYEKQLEELEKYYDEQIDMAQKTAEQMLLNVDKNQTQILNLLKNYGDAYEITGQSLGEKLAQGINNGIAGKIESIIQKIQDSIDAGIENKIKEWTKSNYKYNAESNKPKFETKTVNVYQTNNIEQNPELPSEAYRKLKNIDEQLAAELAEII